MTALGEFHGFLLIGEDKRFSADFDIITDKQQTPQLNRADFILHIPPEFHDPPQRRNVLLLSYIMGKNDVEIGKALNLARTTVRDRRHDGMEKLQELMRGKG